MTRTRSAAVALALLPLLLAGAAGPSVAQTTPAPATAPTAEALLAEYGGSHFKRVTILVSDLDRSLALYRDVLGFVVTAQMPLKETSYAYTMFNVPPAARMRMAMLSSDTQERTLALIEVAGAPINVPTSPRPASMVINAADLPAMVSKAGQMGLTVFKELDLKTVDGKTGKEQGLLDPDGHLVILYQLNP
jgi:catechol 2,3-dioxygenase-like lactoylglutathione lyase family enzyme